MFSKDGAHIPNGAYMPNGAYIKKGLTIPRWRSGGFIQKDKRDTPIPKSRLKASNLCSKK